MTTNSMPEGIAEDAIDALYEREQLPFVPASGRPAPALRLSFPNNHARMAMVSATEPPSM